MIQRLAPSLGCLDEHPQIVAQLPLTDELVERQRADRGLGRIAVMRLGRNNPGRRVFHGAGLFSPWPSS